MPELFGQTMTKEHLKRHVGHMSQIGGAKEYTLTSGAAEGLRAIDVSTGSGFAFTILPGRGMDIAWASYKGIPIGYISKSGVSAAKFFCENAATGFLRNFHAGLLTTGGLSNIGAPSEDGDEAFGLHGRVSNTPAENVCIQQDWRGGDYEIVVTGVVSQGRLFGESLTLRREIRTHLGSSKLNIIDILENTGCRPEPLFLLYHCNFGYPLLSPKTRLYTSSARLEARDGAAQLGLSQFDCFQEPTTGFQEQCFYHCRDDTTDFAYASLFNQDISIGAYVKYKNEHLKYLIEWKMMGEQDYVVGLEPSTARIDGRKNVLSRNEAYLLRPGEKQIFELEIGVFDDAINARRCE